MGRSRFNFQQFSLSHSAAAHPIGTDGILLGAWAQAGVQDVTILDVGCGCGLIGMMLLQRYSAMQLTGLELHPPSAREAQGNLAQSPFSARGQIVEGDFRSWPAQPQFDMIVSNPPFFEPDQNKVHSPRVKARQTFTLSAPDIILRASELLNPNGSVQMILPAPLGERIKATARAAGLHLTRCTTVYSLAGKSPERLLLHWQKDPTGPAQFNKLVLRTPQGTFTEAYRQLTSAFHT